MKSKNMYREGSLSEGIFGARMPREKDFPTNFQPDTLNLLTADESRPLAVVSNKMQFQGLGR